MRCERVPEDIRIPSKRPLRSVSVCRPSFADSVGSKVLRTSYFASLAPSVSAMILGSLSFGGYHAFTEGTKFLHYSSSSEPSGETYASSITGQSVGSYKVLGLTVCRRPLSVLRAFGSLYIFPGAVVTLKGNTLFLLSPGFGHPLVGQVSRTFVTCSYRRFISIHRNAERAAVISTSVTFFVRTPVFFP